MLQQIIALIVVAYFLARQFVLKQRKQISTNEFIFWLIFWLFAAVAIVSLKWIDKLVASLGFTGSGIEVLLYLSVPLLFYLVFRLRLRLERIEQGITKIVREISLSDNNLGIENAEEERMNLNTKIQK